MKESMELILIPMAEIEEPVEPIRKKMTEEGLDELKKSMGARGLLNPITVRRKGSGYEIVEGHRRFLAAKELGWAAIRAILKEVDDRDARIDRIHENLHREDLSPVEEAKQVFVLHTEFKCGIKEIARMCSKSESWVNSRLDMVEWPENILEAVDVGAISVSAARELVAISDDEARDYYLDHAVKSGATRELCAFWRGRWEVEKITRDPSAQGDATFFLNPPPMDPTIRCFWCEIETPIRLIDHLRVCPKCRGVIIEAKNLFELDSFREGLKGVDEVVCG